MRILAVIPARGGSKRAPRKNIRPLGGKPLIIWSIEAAQGIPEICDILVSTDDEEIACVARNAGALVPWLRPAEIATDEASSVDVAAHALDWYESKNEKVDGLLLLQPTSPFRTQEIIHQGIKLYTESGNESVLGVSKADKHPMWALRLENEHLIPFYEKEALETRSQDLPEVYLPNGCLYLISPMVFRATRSFTQPNLLPLIVHSDVFALDIDTELDFKLAEILASTMVTDDPSKS